MTNNNKTVRMKYGTENDYGLDTQFDGGNIIE